MFSFLKNKFFSFCSAFSKRILAIFSGSNFGEEELNKLFELLVSFDLGSSISSRIVNQLRDAIRIGEIKDSKQLVERVENLLAKILLPLEKIAVLPKVVMLFGINGAGKTTTAAKLANLLRLSGKKVLLVAADTYRAAAVEQLQTWSNLVSVNLFSGKENADPASVIFDAAKFDEQNKFDHIIIDTSGRLHTNSNLVKELEKCSRVAVKAFGESSVCNLVVLDSMLGQNSFSQVKVFSSAVKLDGVVLTKLDGSAKGGVVFAIAEEFKIPVVFITMAENDLAGIQWFDSASYIKNLFS